jgi:ABC-2 type transport system permease protein
MSKLYLMVRLNLINSLIERADMVLYTLSNCVSPLVILFVWLSFTAVGATSVYSHDLLIWYFLLAMLVKLLTSAWGGQFISHRIRRGAISPLLIQPVPYYYHWLSNNLAEKLIKLLILMPILIILIRLFHLSPLSVSISSFLLSLLSLLMASVIFFLIDLIIGISAFWLDETSAVMDFYGLLSSLFGGMLIPIIALPPAIRQLALYLPFRFTLSLPIEIFIGQLSASDTFIFLALQAFWLLIFWYLYRYLWSRGLRVYSAAGA